MKKYFKFLIKTGYLFVMLFLVLIQILSIRSAYLEVGFNNLRFWIVSIFISLPPIILLYLGFYKAYKKYKNVD